MTVAKVLHEETFYVSATAVMLPPQNLLNSFIISFNEWSFWLVNIKCLLGYTNSLCFMLRFYSMHTV